MTLEKNKKKTHIRILSKNNDSVKIPFSKKLKISINQGKNNKLKYIDTSCYLASDFNIDFTNLIIHLQF